MFVFLVVLLDSFEILKKEKYLQTFSLKKVLTSTLSIDTSFEMVCWE